MIDDLPVSKVREYTVAGLILNELHLSNYICQLYTRLGRKEQFSTDDLYKFANFYEHITVVKIDQLKTMFEDDDLLNAISYDVKALKKQPRNENKVRNANMDNRYNELTKPDMYDMINDLTKLNATQKGEYSKIVKLKAKIEVDILRMLTYAITTHTDSDIAKIKEILSKYVLYFNPQRFTQKGICTCLSIKFIRNILLENLRNNTNKFTDACEETNKIYNSSFNLAINDECDLIFVYVMLMKQEINPDIKLQEVLYYIFEAISRNDYQSISSLYVLSTAIAKTKAKAKAEEYTKITPDAIISLVEKARHVFLSYDSADDAFEHLSFNCLRTLIFKDQKLDTPEGKTEYGMFFAYILFDHNMNTIRTKINDAGSKNKYSAELSTYYKHISEYMPRVLTVHPYIDLKSDLVNGLINIVCNNNGADIKDATATFDGMDRVTGAVHTLATILKYTHPHGILNEFKNLERFYKTYNDNRALGAGNFKTYLKTNFAQVRELYMRAVYLASGAENAFDGAAVGELYITILNHECRQKLENISSDSIIPLLMMMYPNPAEDSASHAYVKYIKKKKNEDRGGHACYNDLSIDVLDPNFAITFINMQHDIADISIEERNPFEKTGDALYEHVKKYVIFYGGHEYPTWLCWAVPILVFAVIVVVIFGVIYYYSNNEEKYQCPSKNRLISTCFWHNQ